MLNSKQRSYLAGLASTAPAIMQIGKSGVSPETVISAEEALSGRELIKVNVLKTSPDEPRIAADKLAARTHSETVRVIGRKFILYRAFKDEPEIILP